MSTTVRSGAGGLSRAPRKEDEEMDEAAPSGDGSSDWSMVDENETAITASDEGDEESDDHEGCGDGDDYYEQEECDEEGEAHDEGEDDDEPIDWTTIGSCCSSRRGILFWSIGLLFLSALIMLRLRAEEYDFDGLEQIGETKLTHYEIMDVERDASFKIIKQKYRQMSLEVHPDKNLGCKDCAIRFAELSRAYSVLSSPEKRAVYDQIHADVDLIPSHTVELTMSNFDKLVTTNPGVAVIQIYLDWSEDCHRFSSAWEFANERMGVYALFVRLHKLRQAKLMRRIPINLRQLPGVVLFSRGSFVKVLNIGWSQKQFLDIVMDSYPNHVSLASIADIAAMRESNLVALFSSKVEAPLPLKHIAFSYDGTLNVAFVSLRDSNSVSIADMKKQLAGSKIDGWERVTKLPAVLICRSAMCSWIETVSGANLKVVVDSDLIEGMHHKVSTSHQFASLCRPIAGDESRAVHCLILAAGCTISHVDYTEEAFTEVSRSFKSSRAAICRALIVDTSKIKSLRALCNETGLWLVVDAISAVSAPKGSSISDFIENSRHELAKGSLNYIALPPLELDSPYDSSWYSIVAIVVTAAVCAGTLAICQISFAAIFKTFVFLLFVSSVAMQFDWVLEFFMN